MSTIRTDIRPTLPRCAAEAAPPRGGAALSEVLGRRLVEGALARLTGARVTLIDERTGRTSGGGGGSSGVGPAFTVRVRDGRLYAAAAFGGALGIAESYMDGHWTTDDLPGLIEALTRCEGSLRGLEGPASLPGTLLRRLWGVLQRNTRAGSRRNIAAHYDLSNEFFALFLDPTMTYSCAIFENGARTLEEAQREKIDRVCRTLALTPDDHLLEIGTGWGALALHAAREYGCRVTTTTISERQHEHAARLFRDSGMEGRITLLRSDYRDLRGSYTRLATVEMVEAVGAERLDGFMGACSRLLAPGGAMLLQGIVIRDDHFEAASKRIDFLKKHIFPGSCLPSVCALVGSMSRATDMGLQRLEEFGPHYARTLALWRERFMARLDEVRAMGFDERFIRMWEYYLAYCEGVFRAGRAGDVQMLMVKPGCRLAGVGGPSVDGGGA